MIFHAAERTGELSVLKGGVVDSRSPGCDTWSLRDVPNNRPISARAPALRHVDHRSGRTDCSRKLAVAVPRSSGAQRTWASEVASNVVNVSAPVSGQRARKRLRAR